MIKRVRNAAIATKLIASFALIIAIFIAYVIFTSLVSAEIYRLNRHNNDFMIARTEIILDFHQEFTEMRRLLRESFMNPEWRETTMFTVWQSFERQLSDSHSRLTYLSELYKASVRDDYIFPEAPDDARIVLMTETMDFVDRVYGIFSANFFQGRNMNFNDEGVLDFTGAAEENLRELRRLVTVNKDIVWENIETTQAFADVVSIVAVALAVLLASAMAFLMVKSFTGRIKSIETNAEKVAQGDFSADLQGGSDEISKIFSDLVNVFTGLVGEINDVTGENRKGNTRARIDSDKFQGGYKDAVLAVNALLDAVGAEKEKNENMIFMFDHMPIMTTIIDSDMNVIDCNNEVLRLLDISDKQEYISDFGKFFADRQDDGSPSMEKLRKFLINAFDEGRTVFEWLHRDTHGKIIPVEVFVVPTSFRGKEVLIAYARDITAIKEFQAREKEAAERTQLMFDATPLLIEFWDENLVCVDSNPYSLTIFDLPSKEDYNRLVFDLMPEYQSCGTPSKAFWQGKLETIRDAGYAAYEFVCRRLNGELVYTDVVGIRMELNGKTVLVTYSNDVTQLKRSQKDAMDAMERTQLMFDETPMLIEFWNRNNEIIDCNPFAARLFNLNSTEEYFQRYDEFIPRLQPDGTPSWQHWVRSLKKVFVEGRNNFDMTLVDSHGKTIYTEVVGIRMTINGESVAVTYSDDVTLVKESMDKIRMAEERTQLMLDGNPVACYLIDKEFNILDCNREAVALFNFANKDEALSNSREIFTNRGFEEFKKRFDSALDTGFREFEWDMDKPDGSIVPCDVSFVRFALDDGYVIAAYLQDMTAIRQMLEQKEKMEIAEENSMAKSKLLASMSHEIRTPITAVLGISEIQLQNSALPMEVEEAFAKIYDSAGILLNIINDILDISKIEAGKMDLIISRYEVASLAIDTIQMHLVYIGSKRIKFAVNADETMPAYLFGDELRIKQILNNLLSNAFKYTDVGKVTLDIRAEYIDGNHADEAPIYLLITVADTGKGMSRQQLAALQDEYTRFHEKEDRFTQGTGLGMPIVYNTVELMGGKINITSEVGVGTTVELSIPQKISGSEQLGAETVENLHKLESGVLSGTKKMNFKPEPMPYGSILVVDDVETNLYVARGLLGFYDLKIETVGGGYGAVEKVKEGNVYDIIFMDHMMPDLNGIEATKMIRQLGYTGTIVALTANALIGQAEEFMKNGFDGFLSKPIQTVHLNSTLNKFVRDKQPPEVLEAAKAEYDTSADNDDESMEDYLKSSGMFEQVCKDFISSQTNVISEILSAIEANDFKTAHRLAHTLKGLAGLIGEDSLVEFAEKAEAILRRGEIPTEWIGALDQELEVVLAKITELYKDDDPIQP